MYGRVRSFESGSFWELVKEGGKLVRKGRGWGWGVMVREERAPTGEGRGEREIERRGEGM